MPFLLRSSGSLPSSLLLALLCVGILPAFLLSPRSTFAQVGEDASLFREMAVMDSLLFVEGFNGCDLSTTRSIVAGSMEVFPLYNDGTLYGAIQSGQHEFYIHEPGTEPAKTSVAKFTHVWLREGEGWRLTEVLSYDHQSTPE